MDQNSTLPPLPNDLGHKDDPSISPASSNDNTQHGQNGAASIQVPTAFELDADDVDLIEKEWVLKAKDIVAANSSDPFLLNKELNKMRAEYIKKRYNKDIKVNGD